MAAHLVAPSWFVPHLLPAAVAAASRDCPLDHRSTTQMSLPALALQRLQINKTTVNEYS